MAKKKLITLAKELDFSTGQEYFDYMIDSWINGNRSQFTRLYNDMHYSNQKQFIRFLLRDCRFECRYEIDDYIAENL